MQRNSAKMSFSFSESWVVLNPLEQSIKQKIESVGTSLSRWNVSINYGIKTGMNEAFIISGAKRDELIAADPKSADIIRPILRGRDIKRYNYTHADLWLIATFPSRHYSIDDYPAVRDYLLSFGVERLEQTGVTRIIDGQKITSRKKTNNKWFETQDSISYWDDFSKQRIVYREISEAMDACLVEPEVYINNKCYMIAGDHLIYILSFINSQLFTKIILQQANITGGKGEGFLSAIPLIKPSVVIERRIEELYQKRIEGGLQDTIDAEVERVFCDLYGLTNEERRFIYG